jgi:hypothetical protein
MTIKSFSLENFGPLDAISANRLGGINLIIGANSTGKTFLLKALYAIQRAQEETGRGDDRRSLEDVLSEKLYWVFQPERLGDLVARGTGKRLKANFEVADNCALTFGFGPDTTKNVTVDHNNLPKRQANSIFLPPKEVLGLFNVIIKSGLQDRLFGFDATYVDLVLALQTPTQAGRIQFFMATHSYFVIKKLYLITLENKVSVPLLMADQYGWSQNDLRNGIPDNEIINESIRLFDRELEAANP